MEKAIGQTRSALQEATGNARQGLDPQYRSDKGMVYHILVAIIRASGPLGLRGHAVSPRPRFTDLLVCIPASKHVSFVYTQVC